MQVISHRGYWKDDSEKNLPVAFRRSFELGFGTETDLRDLQEAIVISHDMANESSISLTELFTIYNQFIRNSGTLALNIKADGLQLKLKETLEQFGIDNYFVFDMSIPDTIGYINQGIKFFSRQSEYEPQPAFYEKCDGIWLDAFLDTWFDAELIQDHVKKGKQVAIVSSDLHKREVHGLWQMLKVAEVHKIDRVILCTDIPEEALAYFGM